MSFQKKEWLFLKDRRVGWNFKTSPDLLDKSVDGWFNERAPYLAILQNEPSSVIKSKYAFLAKNVKNPNQVLRGLFLYDLDRRKNHVVIKLEQEWTVLPKIQT